MASKNEQLFRNSKKGSLECRTPGCGDMFAVIPTRDEERPARFIGHEGRPQIERSVPIRGGQNLGRALFAQKRGLNVWSALRPPIRALCYYATNRSIRQRRCKKANVSLPKFAFIADAHRCSSQSSAHWREATLIFIPLSLSFTLI